MININSNQESLKTFNKKLKLLKKIEKAQSGFKSNSHIDLTQLHKSTSWNKTPEEVGVLQFHEHNKTVGILLEPRTFDAILKYLDLIDKEMELASFAAMIETRKSTAEFLSGKELTKEALELFDEHSKDIQHYLDNEDQTNQPLLRHYLKSFQFSVKN